MHSKELSSTKKKIWLIYHKVSQNLYRCESPSSGNESYYAVFKAGGKQIRKSLKTADRKLAERRLAELKAKLAGARGRRKPITFGGLLKEFEETVLAAKNLKPRSLTFRKLCNKMLLKVWTGLETLPVRNITRKDCELWFAKRKAQVNPQRQNQELESLNMVLNYGVREGYLLDNPAKCLERVKVPKTQILVPTREQFTVLLDELRARHNSDAVEMVQLLGYSGMRQTEAAELRWGEVHFERNTFDVTGGKEYGGPGTKNNEARIVPLFPPLKNLLLQIRETRGGSPNPDTKVLRIIGCLDGIQRACKARGLPRFDHHCMRHFFVSNCIEAGIDFKAISEWVGHRDGGMLVAKVYGHLRPAHSQAMAAKVTFDAAVIDKNSGPAI
ncbi:MAG: site-specific integrase [Verrucomicrobiae bacterium]|nr:site-specific integrase [Verrucomicrobiae bacterium]